MAELDSAVRAVALGRGSCAPPQRVMKWYFVALTVTRHGCRTWCVEVRRVWPPGSLLVSAADDRGRGVELKVRLPRESREWRWYSPARRCAQGVLGLSGAP